MATEVIGRVRAGSGKSYEVRWDPRSGDVYVEYAGRTRCGSADSASHAMHVAEAWLASK